MAKAGKILAGLLITLIAGCSTKYNEVVPDTVLKVSVINENTNQPVSGATVYLYDDSVAFKKTTSSIADPDGFIASFITNDTGRIVIPKLKSNVQYYVYAYYKDNTIVNGTYITLDNSAKQFFLKNDLTIGSVTSITIPIRPADGFVVIWTQNSNSSALPINTFLESSSVGTITQGNSAPAPFQPGSVTARARTGNITIEGKSATGCFWINQVKVNPGGFVYYNLQDCTVGSMGFYTDNVNSSVLPIQITLNANDAIGSVSSVVSSVPADCSSANVVSALRVPGNYTYQAVSTSGNCVWSGTITVTTGGCNLIYLNKCN
jgi:hypothetical protein